MERGLTQDALAAGLQRAGLDLDRTALAKIEIQLRSVFDFELRMISRVLKVELNVLFPPDQKLDSILPALMKGAISSKKGKIPS